MKNKKMLKPFQGPIHQGCLSCPPVLEIANMDMGIAVGFGSADVLCDGKTFFDGEAYYEKHGKVVTLKEIEHKAAKDPGHDWRVILNGPLRSREYQRQGKDKWALIDSGPGFA